MRRNRAGALLLAVLLFAGAASEGLSQESGRAVKTLDALIARVRTEEARFANHSAVVQTVWNHFPSPDDRRGGGIGGAFGRFLLRATRETVRQDVNGDRFRYLGEESIELDSGDRRTEKHLSVCDGADTLWIDDDLSTLYRSHRSEPPLMRPPHAWGLFALDVSFPLSVYLGGAEAMKGHPKVGRSFGGGSRVEFTKVEAELQGEEPVGDLPCVKVLVRRWYHATEPPAHQTLWLAVERNFHVARTRWASVRKGVETPQEESRVLEWKEAAPGLWYPSIVEMRAISPERARKDAAEVNRRLSVESLTVNPAFEEGTFRLPAVPETLPRFEVAEGKLTGSPNHPAAAVAAEGTTLDAILKRLAVEEARYDDLEVVTIERYRAANPSELSSSNIIVRSESRKRSLLAGGRALLKETQESRYGENGLRTTGQHQVFDGSMTRMVSRSAGPKETAAQESASVQLGEKNMTNVVRPHRLLFDSHESIKSLGEYLRSGAHGENPMSVSWVGDETVGGLHCHKLRCDVGEPARRGDDGKPLDRLYFFLWLARDRNLIPVRRQWTEPYRHPDMPTGVHWTEDLREIRPGLWYPHRASSIAFRKWSSDGLIKNRIRTQWRQDLTVESLQVDPAVKDDTFAGIEVSQGTMVFVTDENGERLGHYVQPETGDIAPTDRQLKELRDAARKRAGKADEK